MPAATGNCQTGASFYCGWQSSSGLSAFSAPLAPQRRLHRTRAPTSAQLTHLADKIAHRVCRHLARKGWLEGEEESVFLTDSAGCDEGMDALRMSSITDRIATGAQAATSPAFE